MVSIMSMGKFTTPTIRNAPMIKTDTSADNTGLAPIFPHRHRRHKQRSNKVCNVEGRGEHFQTLVVIFVVIVVLGILILMVVNYEE